MNEGECGASALLGRKGEGEGQVREGMESVRKYVRKSLKLPTTDQNKADGGIQCEQ